MTTMMMNQLQTAVSDDVAIRFVARLQPAGGRGDKVFPPTYAGGQYAIEERIDEHCEVKKVVLLDSVQSQANRMEQALLAAHRAGRVQLPLVTVDFSGQNELREIGEITVLDAPHRLADAILRDSMLNGTLFPATPKGQVLRRATPRNATELFRLCPVALLFGVWESTGAAVGNRWHRCRRGSQDRESHRSAADRAHPDLRGARARGRNPLDGKRGNGATGGDEQ